MRIFISHSGKQSLNVADALSKWLPQIFPGLEVWISKNDIDPGDHWMKEIAKSLNKADLGILCLTLENRKSPWVLFEAGALLRVPTTIPYLIDLKPEQLPDPIRQYNGVTADKKGTFSLVQSIARSRRFDLPPTEWEKQFRLLWPELAKQFEHQETSEIILKVDTRPLLGKKGRIETMTFNTQTKSYQLLDEIFFKLNETCKVPPYTYGNVWLLKDRGRRELNDEPIQTYIRTRGRISDNRLLSELGIKDQARLWVVPGWAVDD